MTTPFRRSRPCPNCGHKIAIEDEFSQWYRQHPELDSSDGFAVMDKDLIVHRFKTDHGREFQCIMCVEVKTHGAKLRESQRDTMILFNQFLRNRQATPTKKIPKQLPGAPNYVWSHILKRNVCVKAFGIHTLTLSGTTPDNSSEIVWDSKHFISESGLVSILRFDLDPDTLERLDFRKHHSQKSQKELPL